MCEIELTPREKYYLQHRLTRLLRRKLNNILLDNMYGGREARIYEEQKKTSFSWFNLTVPRNAMGFMNYDGII